MLIRAKKHVLSSYSYSNLSFHRKITKTTQKWVVFFYTKIKRRRPQKNTAHGRTVGASRAFSVRQVMTVRNGKTAGETDRSRGEARQRDFITAHSSIMAGFYEPRTTSHEPLFSRAEGYSRRCIQFEFVAAKRHLSPRRPATGGAVGPKIKKFKFFCFFRRNLHPRVEYYTYKGRDHKE